MNSNERIIYEQRNLMRRVKLERSFMRPVYNALKAFNVQFVPILKERGVEAVRAAVNKVSFDYSVGEAVRLIYKVAGIKYATWTYNEIQRSARTPKKSSNEVRLSKLIGSQINFNERWEQDIINYFRMYLINKAVLPITIASKARIMEILDQGTREGWSIERMAKELETDEFTKAHARLVVRTETAKAAYYGRRLGASDSGFETTKEWVSAKDSRVRHSHRDMDGETIDYNNKYNVPIYRKKVIAGYELMLGPGDPEASAENVCNCRCTEAYAAKRDSNGRIIRKPVPKRVSVIKPGSFNNPNITVTI